MEISLAGTSPLLVDHSGRGDEAGLGAAHPPLTASPAFGGIGGYDRLHGYGGDTSHQNICTRAVYLRMG
jgi:hypothetical protein